MIQQAERETDPQKLRVLREKMFADIKTTNRDRQAYLDSIDHQNQIVRDMSHFETKLPLKPANQTHIDAYQKQREEFRDKLRTLSRPITATPAKTQSQSASPPQVTSIEQIRANIAELKSRHRS